MALRNPVIVTGFYRSGTSLLYALLNGHSRIALMYECSVWEMPNAFARIRYRRNWLERQEFYNKALSRHRLIFGDGFRGLEKVRTPEDLYRVYAQTRNAEIWGEKSPLYGPHLRRLAEQNPLATFILVWRNPVETYRSVLSAGRGARFFRRNMLSRMIFSHEEIIRQAAELEKGGRKIAHVAYDDLVDRPAEVCRNLCQFLEIEFDEKMLDLRLADLSAIDLARHHDHLRRRAIERRVAHESAVHPETIAKLQRFRKRWRRLRGVPAVDTTKNVREPGVLEQLWHQSAGRWLISLDAMRRTIFEFFPLGWLQSYRQTKGWFLARRHQPATADYSLGKQIRHHSLTLVVCAALLILAASADRLAGPSVTLAPLYAIPVGAIALLINRAWGTGAAVACALVWSFTKIPLVEASAGIFLWNTTMRFLLLQLIVTLIDRIHIEAAFDDLDCN